MAPFLPVPEKFATESEWANGRIVFNTTAKAAQKIDRRILGRFGPSGIPPIIDPQSPQARDAIVKAVPDLLKANGPAPTAMIQVSLSYLVRSMRNFHAFFDIMDQSEVRCSLYRPNMHNWRSRAINERGIFQIP